MRGGSKTLLVALVALALAAGLPACGGGDDSDSTEAAGQQQSGSQSSKQADAKGGEDKNGSGDSASSAGKPQGGGASDFVPKQHEDSGGGSEQFKVKGGDNSVQEFGTEAAGSEFEEAAVALHNFLDARAEGNWAAVCDYMSKGTIESFERVATQTKQAGDTSCGGILEKLINPAAEQSLKDEAAQADVRSLRIEGEQAFLIYTGTEGTVLAMPMAPEGGDWKVASLAGTPLS